MAPGIEAFPLCDRTLPGQDCGNKALFRLLNPQETTALQDGKLSPNIADKIRQDGDYFYLDTTKLAETAKDNLPKNINNQTASEKIRTAVDQIGILQGQVTSARSISSGLKSEIQQLQNSGFLLGQLFHSPIGGFFAHTGLSALIFGLAVPAMTDGATNDSFEEKKYEALHRMTSPGGECSDVIWDGENQRKAASQEVRKSVVTMTAKFFGASAAAVVANSLLEYFESGHSQPSAVAETPTPVRDGVLELSDEDLENLTPSAREELLKNLAGERVQISREYAQIQKENQKLAKQKESLLKSSDQTALARFLNHPAVNALGIAVFAFGPGATRLHRWRNLVSNSHLRAEAQAAEMTNNANLAAQEVCRELRAQGKVKVPAAATEAQPVAANDNTTRTTDVSETVIDIFNELEEGSGVTTTAWNFNVFSANSVFSRGFTSDVRMEGIQLPSAAVTEGLKMFSKIPEIKIPTLEFRAPGLRLAAEMRL